MTQDIAAVTVNRAPVLTLWAAVVAERLGLERDEALTVGRVLAGLTAHAKGVRLGIYEPSPSSIAEQRRQLPDGEVLHLRLMGRDIPVVRTPDGLRAAEDGRPVSPASVERYLRGKFGEALEPVRAAMAALAASLPPDDLARRAFRLYEDFRPEVKPGAAGWGAAGVLDIGRIRKLAEIG